MNEVNLYKQIIDYCNSVGCYVFRSSVGGRGRYKFGKKGQCDITGVLPDGRRLEIEVKSKRGKLSKSQELYIEKMRSKNAVVIVAKKLYDVIEVLKNEC